MIEVHNPTSKAKIDAEVIVVGDARYLKLDCSNDPLTAGLEISLGAADTYGTYVDGDTTPYTGSSTFYGNYASRIVNSPSSDQGIGSYMSWVIITDNHIINGTPFVAYVSNYGTVGYVYAYAEHSCVPVSALYEYNVSFEGQVLRTNTLTSTQTYIENRGIVGIIGDSTNYDNVVGTLTKTNYGGKFDITSGGTEVSGTMNTTNYGFASSVFGQEVISGMTTSYGVYSVVYGTSNMNYGVFASIADLTGYAGFFIGNTHLDGDVHISGTLTGGDVQAFGDSTKEIDARRVTSNYDVSNVTGSGSIEILGDYSNAANLNYKVEITTAGDIGVAKYRWSDDGGSTWDESNITTDYNPRSMNNGLKVWFKAGTGTDFNNGDYITFVGIGTANQKNTLLVDNTNNDVTLAHTFLFANSTITDSSGAISFDNENLTTTGRGTFGEITCNEGLSGSEIFGLNSDALSINTTIIGAGSSEAGTISSTGRNTLVGANIVFTNNGAVSQGHQNTFIGEGITATFGTFCSNVVCIGARNTLTSASNIAGTVMVGGNITVAGYSATVIGADAFCESNNSVAIGAGAGVASESVAFGNLARARNYGSIAIGHRAGYDSNGIYKSILIGEFINSTTHYQLLLGGLGNGKVNDVYFGQGVTYTSLDANITIQPTGGSGTNVAGTNFIVAAGKGTGNATPGYVSIKTSTAGASGATLQTLTERVRVTTVTTIYDVLVLNSITSDPASPTDGSIWYRSDTDEFRVRINGATKVMVVAEP